MSKFNSEPVTLVIPYEEVVHLKDMVDVADDKCLKCEALKIHLTRGIREAAKNAHNKIKRISIKKHKNDAISFNDGWEKYR